MAAGHSSRPGPASACSPPAGRHRRRQATGQSTFGTQAGAQCCRRIIPRYSIIRRRPEPAKGAPRRRRHARWPPFTEPGRKSPSHSYRGAGIIMSARPQRTNSLIALPSKTTATTGRTITGGSHVVTSCLSRKSSLRQRSPRQWKNVHRRPRGARAATDKYRSTCQRAKRRRLRTRTTSIAARARPPTM
jgi:hypothetical protein